MNKVDGAPDDRLPLIELENVARAYEGEKGLRVKALEDVSLRIEAGEFVCITGPSGSGKSTLMNLVGCMDRPSSGSYRLAGQEVSDLGSDSLAWLRRNMFGFVFQSYNLLESATALENVELPGRYAGMANSLRRERALRLLSQLEVSEQAGRLPAELSGGEQQRVSIARALMNGGRVLLADEPTGALDRDNAEEVLCALEELAVVGHTVVIISHNPEIAARATRRIELLDGRIVSDSGPEAIGAKLPDDAFADRPGGLRLGSGATESIRAGWAALRTGLKRGRRLRTVLPVLCVTLAVVLGATALCVGQGAYLETVAKMNDMGLEQIVVHARTRNSPSGEFTGLTRDDAEAIEQHVPNIRAVSPAMFLHYMTVRRGNVSALASVIGQVDLGTKENRGPTGYRMDSGAFVTQQEDDNLAQVAVLGPVVRDRLFPPDMNPIGQQILIENIPFRVKGLLKRRSATIGGSPSEEALRVNEENANNWAYVPLQTASKLLFPGAPYVNWISVYAEDPDHLLETASAIRDLGIRRHGGDVFLTEHLGPRIEYAKRLRKQVRLVYGVLAGVVLLSGNVSVMIIMLMWVRSRRREIGVRMAVGARRRDILRHFLSESMVVSIAGGLLGALAALVSVTVLFDAPVSLSPWFFAVPFACAIVVGLPFSAVPAARAARLDPVAALAET